MSPQFQAPRYRVDLNTTVPDDLASAMIAYFPVREGHRVTTAEQIIMYLLADDPLRNGTMIREDLYRIVASPLIALYEIYEASLIVRVTKIGFYRV